MILKYLKKKEWAFLALAVIFITGSVYFDLKIPDYMSEITTLLNTGGTVDQVLNEGLWMLACAFGSMALSIAVGYIAAYVSAGLSRTLRDLEFQKVQSFSMAEMNKFSTASLITRSTNDVTQVRMAMAFSIQLIIKAPILAVWAVFKIAGKGEEWTMLTAIAVIIVILVLGAVLMLVVPRFKKIQWITDDLNRVTREGITGIRVVRAYNAEDYQETKFEKANTELTTNNLFVNRSMAFLMPALTFLMNMLSLSIYWTGAYLISSAPDYQARLELFSNMIVFSSYAMQVVMAFIFMIMAFMILPRAMVAARRIEEVINTEPSIKDGTVTETPNDMDGTVSFRNVGFKYADASDYVLKDISFDAKKGETVAFIGSTGSGKSTLINLIPRFYDATEGEVLVDGVNVKEYEQEALRRKIGYVSQKATMFAGTISSNVKYGDVGATSTEDEIKRAISIAQGTEFVEKMDQKYQSLVSQGGTNLSGGQKQRMSIARAVNRNPEIFIFDDSFSALDYKTDRVLRTALKKETAGVTSLIVAQRIGTIMDADKIIVLEDGRVVGIGKHKELLSGCKVYREIAESQLSEEELGL